MCLTHTLIWICNSAEPLEQFITERSSTINGILKSTLEAQTSESPSSVKHITLGKQTYFH